METLHMTERQHLQEQMFNGVLHAINQNRIVLAEGSTGIGKTRVENNLGKALYDSKGAKTRITSPTLATLLQLVQDAQRRVHDFPLFTVRFSRSNFIHPERTREVVMRLLDSELSEEARYKYLAIIAWLDDGCRPYDDGCAKEYAKIFPQLSHFVDDLQQLAGEDFPIGECLMEANDAATTPALEAIEALIQAAAEAPITYSTIAMMAREALQRWKTNTPPPYDYLIIDEGHEVEDIVASAVSTNLSTLAFSKFLREFPAARHVSAHLDLLTYRLKHHTDKKTYLLDSRISKDEELSTFIRQHCRMMGQALKPLRSVKNREEWLEMLQTVGKETSYRIRINFSKVKHLPSIILGPPRVDGFLKKLWSEVRGAALFSGTFHLYSDISATAKTPIYMKAKLALPDNYYPLPPVLASWTRSQPEVRIPSQTLAETLVYPKDLEDDEGSESLQTWRLNVLTVVDRIVEDAVGGTLILCNSNSDAAAFEGMLRQIRGNRVFKNTDRMNANKMAFKKAAYADQRPIWFTASTAAWTGLDLSDPDKTRDNILTDLVIVRTPLGLSHTSTYLSRCRSNPNLVYLEGLLRFLQGLGRLVRHPDRENRRIWFLDGRSYKAGAKQPFVMFRKLIEKQYTNVKYITS